MKPDDSEESGSDTILSRRELLGASATLGAAALASATPGVGSVSAQSSTEPRIALGSDYTVDDDPNGNGDLVIEHGPSGNRFTYDASAGEWTAGKISANQVTTDDVSITNVGASVYLSAAQTVSNATNTKVAFDTVIYDDENEFDTTNNQFVAAEAGKYKVSAAALWKTSIAAGKRLKIMVFVNGANTGGEYVVSGGDKDGMGITKTVDLASGDTVSIYVYQSSGGSAELHGLQNWTWADFSKLG